MALDILFIEDNPPDHLLAEHVLQRAGLLAHGLCVDSEAALIEALASRRWHLLVSDYSVPGMRFTDTLARMLRHHPETPVILFSATVGDAKAAVLLQLGVRAYLPKSRVKDLPALVERVVGAGGPPAPQAIRSSP